MASIEMSHLLTLSRHLAKNITSGVNYANRSLHIPNYRLGDVLWLAFTPGRVDYAQLLASIDVYIEHFEASELSICSREFLHFDWASAPNCAGTGAIRPIHFFDRKMCRDRFGLAVPDVLERLRAVSTIEEARPVRDGVLIIVSSGILDLEQQKQADVDVRRALGLV